MSRRPAAFTAFVRNLGVGLEPGQLVFCKVAFDGCEPSDLEGEERELARRIFGAVDVVPPEARNVVAAVCGRASGKTKLSSLRLLHLAITVPLTMLGRGQVALVPIVAPKLKLATECFSMVKGEVQAHPSLASMLKNPDSSESILLERPDGKRVSIEPIAATAGGGAVRGRNIPAALLEECAFFRDDNFKVNDAEIFSAVVPRLLPGGQALLVSSPWVRSGLLYGMHRDNFGQPTTALVAHAPTLVMRSRADVRAMAERERQRDAENFRIEFDAQFLDAAASQFFDETTLEKALDKSVTLGAKPRPGTVVTHGGDFGFVHDSSALVTAHLLDGTITVADLLEVKPEPGAPLKPSKVCELFAARARLHGGDTVMVDGHYREAVREHLEAHGLYLRDAPEGQGGKASAYVKARSLMREGRVRIPHDERLLRQLREVTAKPTPGGGLAVSSPRGPGGHGDLVSALVLALWQEHGAEVAAKPPPIGSEEHWRAIEAHMLEAWAERHAPRSGDWSDGGGNEWA